MATERTRGSLFQQKLDGVSRRRQLDVDVAEFDPGAKRGGMADHPELLFDFQSHRGQGRARDIGFGRVHIDAKGVIACDARNLAQAKNQVVGGGSPDLPEMNDRYPTRRATRADLQALRKALAAELADTSDRFEPVQNKRLESRAHSDEDRAAMKVLLKHVDIALATPEGQPLKYKPIAEKDSRAIDDAYEGKKSG